MGIEWCDWFGRWVNGGRGGRVTMCGFGGLCCWYGVGILGVGACWNLLQVCCIYC